MPRNDSRRPQTARTVGSAHDRDMLISTEVDVFDTEINPHASLDIQVSEQGLERSIIGAEVHRQEPLCLNDARDKSHSEGNCERAGERLMPDGTAAIMWLSGRNGPCSAKLTCQSM